MIDYQDINMLRAIGLNVVMIETKEDLDAYFGQVIPFNAIRDTEVYGDLSGPRAFWPEVVVDYWVYAEGQAEIYQWYYHEPENPPSVYNDCRIRPSSSCLRFF